MGAFSKDLQTYVSPKFNEELFLEILQDIFHIKNAHIKDISFDYQCKKGDSYLSTVTKFLVKGNGKDDQNGNLKEFELPVISKCLPSNIARRKTFRSLDFFENEVAFYNTVWKAMREFQISKCNQPVFDDIPLCISALSDGIHDYVTLENLSTKGYISPPRCNGLDFNHTLLILQLFAKFHAVGLAFKDQQPKRFEEIASTLKETYFAEEFRSWYEPFQTKSLYAVVCDAVAKQLPEFYLNKLKKLFENDLFGMLIHHCETRGPLAVITHGDAWIPNFLLKYDTDKKTPLSAIMIDFQLARYASLANDVVFFLYTCTDQSLRLKHWDELIEEYHKTFVQVLTQLGSNADLLTLDALKTEIKTHSLVGVGMSMEAVVMSLLEDDETADLDKITGDQEVPLESVWVLHPFQQEEKRQRLADVIKHAVDHDFI